MIIRHLEVSRDIAASPEAAYDAIADVTRMGEWSTECHTCEWVEGSAGPAVGAQFVGHNSNNGADWSIVNTVTAAERGKQFTFECSSRDFHFATWSYTFEATENGCTVTETWDDLRPDEAITKPSISGVENRAEYNRQSMATTLERVAAAVE